MARYLNAKCKVCRREGMKLFLKGARCNTEKCSFTKRPNPPGMRIRRPSKPSYYALQLREKQKTKRIYGLLEKQFKRFFKLSSKSKGVTGRKLLQLLELRLDNVIYKSLFALSRAQSRQIVLHGFIFIDSRRVNIPSYIVKEQQTIEIKANEKFRKEIKENIEINSKNRSIPTWLEVDKENLKIKVLRPPEKEDIGIAIDEQLIVELYSK